jgi:hypothetical protein
MVCRVRYNLCGQAPSYKYMKRAGRDERGGFWNVWDAARWVLQATLQLNTGLLDGQLGLNDASRAFSVD